MKLKKLVAAVCAAAMAVSAVAVTPLFSSAATKPVYEFTADKKEAYVVPVDESVDYAAVRAIEAVITASDGKSNGCVGASDPTIEATDGNDWINSPWTGSTKCTLKTPNGVKSGSVQVQVWWLNSGTVTVDSVTFTDENGKVLQEIKSEEIIDDDVDEEENDCVELLKTPYTFKPVVLEMGEYGINSIGYDVRNDWSNLLDVSEYSKIEATYTLTNPAYFKSIVVCVNGGTYEWKNGDQLTTGTATYELSGGNLAQIVVQGWWDENNEFIKSHVKSDDNSAPDAVDPGLTLTSVKLIKKAASGDDDKKDDDKKDDNNNNTSSSTVVNVAPPAPSEQTISTNNTIKKLKNLKAGSEYTLNLTKVNSVVKKLVIKQIVGKDITITITYAGHTWTVNGKDVDTAKPLNFRKALDPDSGYKLPSYVKEVK